MVCIYYRLGPFKISTSFVFAASDANLVPIDINDFSIEGVSTLEEIEAMGTGEFQSLLIPVREAVPAHVL